MFYYGYNYYASHNNSSKGCATNRLHVSDWSSDWSSDLKILKSFLSNAKAKGESSH